MALYHFSAKVLSRSGRNTVRALAYRAGCKLYDERTEQTFNYENKPVQHVELVLPKDAPEWARDIQKLMGEDRQKGVQAFSDIVEAAETRVDAQVYREFEFALHRELTKEQNIALAREFVEDQICSHGMSAQMNFHFDVDEETGEEKPHCHVAVTTRRLEENGLSPKKERDWNAKSFLCELRVKWEEYSNFHLKLHGHDIQIDHRSNKERGIEMEPQPKLGRGVLEQEKRLQERAGGEELSPLTDKAKAFHAVQLRNLYRIMRRPEVVFEIVTKHHSTFMWTDVQKKLHQYVDEAPLFQRLEARLKNSNELLVLRLDGVKDTNGTIQGKAIYTSRSVLKAERSLVNAAEELGTSLTHGVDSTHIERAIAKANEELAIHGGLSQDQDKAIRHLVEEGQLKCVVGIAGAGKTTALGVCHDIWKAEGYAVYGLAPTGKAAQNLEHNGINSTTAHKFLKAFAEGRCQYNTNSVLVLDEAGMVDIERFEKLLNAVKQLGVKLIVVGDGAQLQPVEAGPAFRLVTERLGRSELNTVVRQKEEWQKEATALFGKQETKDAIQAYADKGCVHIIKERLPSLKEALANGNKQEVVKLYEVSLRVSSLIYREMVKDVKKEHPYPADLLSKDLSLLVKEHQDFHRYLTWNAIKEESAKNILKESGAYRPLLEERAIDLLKMAMIFVDRGKPKFTQHEEAIFLLKTKGLDHLIGIEKQRGLGPTGQSVDVRQTAKAELIKAWHAEIKNSPEKNSVMLAYSNRDVNELNQSARSLLKESGQISQKEFTYTIRREIEDDFGRKTILKEDKGFSKGDRIVFTRNNYGLGVNNGSMGTIMDLNHQRIQVKLDEGQEISFAPNLNPHFDQGWAVTIHKSQGTTVDRTFVLASYEMTQNLAYVAMTRHREEVKVFGSSLDFWRPEKLPEVLSKSGEKLSAADYLDSDSLSQLMKKDDTLLTKIFTRVSNELDAMGAVTKKVFWQVADHFLGNNSQDRAQERDIHVHPESIREEVRAEKLLQQKQETPTLQTVYEEMKHPAFAEAVVVKKAFEKGLKVYGEEQAIAYWESKKEPYLQQYQQHLAKVETELSSPLLTHLTDKWKDQARETAKQDPIKALDLLSKLQNDEGGRRERLVVEERAAQERTKQDHIQGVYQKYWHTQEMIKDHPSVQHHYKDYLEGLAKEMYKDKAFMSTLRLSDASDARHIEHMAQGQKLQEQHQEKDHIRSLDRGGYSL